MERIYLFTSCPSGIVFVVIMLPIIEISRKPDRGNWQKSSVTDLHT